MYDDPDRAVVLGWSGTLVECHRGGARLFPGADAALSGARLASIPVIVLTGHPLEEVAAHARRLRVADRLSIVIAGDRDPVAELAALRAEYTRLAFVGSTRAEITRAHRAGVLAFGFSGGGCSGKSLRAAGAESVLSKLDRSLALRVTEQRLFSASGNEAR
ncbi:hypothetical protein CDG81_17525 [Actinopolyspora erythraea]|uniref:Uncharacterized protein n=1 Tax=Actinopolyspora erythraea TaxID=414996 RepID=A0A099D2K0_9ACTN|nr:hypothetical protein [Actinopolyspora erythraea]ASU79764.1 hypothetical protein CDG81_17525 [Actinopolyspora erythraea]KGI79510.1 hypothetical protein IL38_22555 [Actinopolyspora erythraea]